MSEILDIIKDKTLTFEQRVITLAKAAENSIEVIDRDKKVVEYMDEGVICGLFEGNAPYRPRYIVPDYGKFMEQGSEFLNLKPAKDIWEATNNLLILYKHVPSITTFPVYIGNIDKLLDPFIEDEDQAYRAIKQFLLHIDRTITDSFCHANIGPEASRAGELILRAEKELENAIPNITLKYDSDLTSDEFAIKAIETALVTAKPSFANNKMFREDFKGDYGIVSCYNGLDIGGGSYTLVRLNLADLANKAKDEEDFLNNILPEACDLMADYMDQRVKFIVEESGFFDHHFLVKEGLISRDKFTAMFAMFGLAECVNRLLKAEKLEDKFGHSQYANDLGEKIIKIMDEKAKSHDAPYCEVSDGHYLLHAQVGIETDFGISPGCRIPIGDEPSLPEHILQTAKFHKYFPSGIGDIFPFEETAKKNPESVLDIIKGAFDTGMRYFSLYGSDADVIRITGYLVKKSDMEKLARGEQVLQDTVVLGLGARENSKILERKVRDNA